MWHLEVKRTARQLTQFQSTQANRKGGVHLADLRILIADDHTLFRQGLRQLLQLDAAFRVVGEASDGYETVELARSLEPDIVLLDVVMPRRDGMEALREMAGFDDPPKILLLTGSLGKADTIKALKLGAYGVLLKEATTGHLFDSIRCVMAGQYWVGRESVSDLVKALRSVEPFGGERPNEFGLTPRENEIISMVVEGYSNADIAQRCRISEQTVKHHIGHIFDKLGSSNRLELALFAVNHRLWVGEA